MGGICWVGFGAWEPLALEGVAASSQEKASCEASDGGGGEVAKYLKATRKRGRGVEKEQTKGGVNKRLGFTGDM